MAITRYLTSQPYVNAGDQVVILAERNGDMRRTSVAAISDFVKAAIAAGGGSSGGGGTPSWGSIVGNISAQADLAAQLANKQPLLPSGGTSANFLRGDGVWAVPAGGGSSAATWGSITGTLSSQTDLINALSGKENSLPVGTSIQYLRGNKTLATLDKAAVNLANVDNTSDSAKPISTATQSALDAKEPTIAPGNTTQYWRGDKTWQTLPTGGSGAAWGSITGALSSQTDLANALAGKEPSITATSTSQYFRGDKTFQTLDKTAVGLNNVDNTSDVNKPISSATQSALSNKEGTIAGGTTGQYWRGDKTFQALNAGAVGLGNVNNTSDAAKPISTATQSALDAKAPLASPALTGTPTAPTAANGTNTTQIATTAFVLANATGSGGFANPMTTQGDTIVGGAGGTPTRLGAGTNNYVLTSNGPGAAPSWKVATGSGASNANSVSVDSIRGPSRSQLARNRDRVSIYDFGAIGTGTFDNNPLSTRYATLQDAQAAYPTLTNLSLSDQIDWAALQSGVDYMQSTGKILDLAGARLCVNRETVFRNSGFIFIKGSRAEIGGKRMSKPWINNGDTVAADMSYPTETNPGPIGGCCFYAFVVPYYAYIEDINFNDFRFGISFLNDPNSPIFHNCNFNYTNCGVIYYQGCQNPRYSNCGGGQLGVLHVSSVTAFPSGHPSQGNDNYYSDNVTIITESGYASIGSNPSQGFDNFLRDSILRPTVDSIVAGGTSKYNDRNGNVYTDPFYLNATGRICYMPFRNLRDCFSFTMTGVDSRGGLRYGYALVNTEIAALKLEGNNYEQLFEALPVTDTTAALLTCGSVYSGTLHMASQIDYIDNAHPMITYNGRGQSRGTTDGSSLTLLGTSILLRKGDKPLGFNSGVLYANRLFTPIDELTQNRTQGRPDANAPADFLWYINGRELYTNVFPGRTMIESNPLIVDLPYRTADNVRRVNALVSLQGGFAGYLKATVYNANANIPVDSAVYYWDSFPTEVFTLNQAVNNGDTSIVLSGVPNQNYGTPRYSKWTFDAQTGTGFLMNGYMGGTTVQAIGPVGGLSGTIASGTGVRRTEKLSVIRAFSQSWIRLGIFNSSEGTVPFHGAGSLGIRNLLAGDTSPNASPELRVILTLHHTYPG